MNRGEAVRARRFARIARAGAVAGAVFLGGFYVAAVLRAPVDPAPARRVVWVAPDDVDRVPHDTNRAPGCRRVMWDDAVARNLARAGIPVTALDVGDGSVMWRVAGQYVGWADFPETVIPACVPAHLAAAAELAQP
jgi:hypothetical protein